jgi:rubredoxin
MVKEITDDQLEFRSWQDHDHWPIVFRCPECDQVYTTQFGGHLEGCEAEHQCKLPDKDYQCPACNSEYNESDITEDRYCPMCGYDLSLD